MLVGICTCPSSQDKLLATLQRIAKYPARLAPLSSYRTCSVAIRIVFKKTRPEEKLGVGKEKRSCGCVAEEDGVPPVFGLFLPSSVWPFSYFPHISVTEGLKQPSCCSPLRSVE